MSDELLRSASTLLLEATHLDKADKPNDAFSKYMLGVEKLMDYRKQLLTDDPRREAFNQKIIGYITRAEELKAKTKIETQFLEQRRIVAGSTGHGYDVVFSKCLDDKLTAVSVQDAYIVAHHQILNFVRFCELVVRNSRNIKLINLLTGSEAESNAAAFSELGSSLSSKNVKLVVKYNPSLHDREIRFNNGWVVKIGRGLDYFKNPGRYAIGACDLNLRPCHETTIDIFRVKA